jgi:hypothetical protein
MKSSGGVSTLLNVICTAELQWAWALKTAFDAQSLRKFEHFFVF